ncbi:autophagy-related protein 7 [Hordeum vulgare]|nr:autophagy-related protein 7 [Hordeum vulgare]
MRTRGPTHNLYAMSRRLIENELTNFAAQNQQGTMLPAMVGVDEVVGEDDGDAGNELVLDKDEGGGRPARLSYYNSYKDISLSVEDMVKGKSPVMELLPPKPPSMSTVAKKWSAPEANMVGLSTDGSFKLDDGTAGSGMILRDNKGDVIFASYRKFFQCNDALEAELQAIKEGLQLAFIHASLPVVLQSDSVMALKMIATSNYDRSPYGVLVLEIKSLLLNREVSFLKISRE